MDERSFLKREVEYTRLWGIVFASLTLWIAPKYMKSAIAWELGSGVGATCALLTAAYQVSRLEKAAMYERAQQAAQQDLFTSELAMEVYLQQLQQQQAINAMVTPQMPPQASPQIPPQHQVTKFETPLPQQTPQQIQTINAPAMPQAAPGPETFDIKELRNYPSAIIFGPQSSGKTSLTKLIVQDRMQSGHTCEALDPHGSKWPCPSIGAGMDYGAIASRLSEITELIKERYQYCRENEVDPNEVDFPPVSLICDEFTNWGTRINNDLVVSFIRECWSDIRKINILAIFLNHTNTIEGGLSGATGLAALRDKGCIQVELFADKDPVTGEAIPSGRGKLYRPGQPPVDIVIPQLRPNATVQNQVQPTNLSNHYPEPLEPLMNQGYSSIPSMVQNPVQVHEPQVQPPFSYLNPNLQAQVAAAIATGQPKVKSIQNLLGISKGGSSAWQQASSDWDAMKAQLL